MQALPQRGLLQQAQAGMGHRLGIPGGYQQRRFSIFHHIRDPAHARTDHRYTTGHRLQQGIGHVIGKAGIQHDIGLPVQGGHGISVQTPRELHGLVQAQISHKLP